MYLTITKSGKCVFKRTVANWPFNNCMCVHFSHISDANGPGVTMAQSTSSSNIKVLPNHASFSTMHLASNFLHVCLEKQLSYNKLKFSIFMISLPTS